MPLNVAVIGAGHMGRIHLDKLAAFEGVRIVSVVDQLPDLSRTLAEKYGIPFGTDYRRLAGPLDGVIIATPTVTHHEIASWFLKKNVHVFTEKPIAASPKEGRSLVRLAKKQKRILQIGHLERFNLAFRKAVPLMQRPLIIDAIRCGPFTGRSTDVDVVHDLMIHDIDLLLSIVKTGVKSISARGVAFVTDRFDMASVNIEFKDGCFATLTANRISTRKERHLAVYEQDRYFSINLLKGRLTSMFKDMKGNVTTTEYEAEVLDPVRDQLSEFIDSMKGIKTPTVTGEDGLSALALAGRITKYIARSAKTPSV